MKLAGRAALATGANRGIGEACAPALAAQGALVGFAARSTEDLGQIAAESEGAVALQADLGKGEWAQISGFEPLKRSVGGVGPMTSRWSLPFWQATMLATSLVRRSLSTAALPR
jgi:NAD(P)-dependent dehydrogenase (short-subunit alcohol dehydrogenase family)